MAREIMRIISEDFNVPLVEEEEFLKCENELVKVSCQLGFDDSGFILAKSDQEMYINKIEEIVIKIVT